MSFHAHLLQAITHPWICLWNWTV